ncbi:MAG: ABC transporter permease subunit [Bdellovibrionales bacterium]|nr:ABC transporter permease subunit [Bdellovibrionales bacterium]
MTAYFLRRFLLIIPTFIGITMLVFVVTRFVPGGPIERMITQAQMMQGDRGGMSDGVSGAALSEDQIEDMKKYYGFDKPPLEAYVIWLWKVLHLDLGVSSRYNEPVWNIIKERFPVSIFYGLTTMIIAYLVSVPLGIIKAIKHSTLFDNITSGMVFLGFAIPNYVLGIGLIVLFASQWEVFPLGQFRSDDWEDLTTWGKIVDQVYHAVLPITSYLAGTFAVTTLLTKNSLMDNLAADYVRTAIAKGLPFKKAIFGHALRNSLIPLATSFGNNISVLLAGSFLVETVFNIDGFGLLGFESVVERDYPVVMGILVLSSLLFLIGNILSDICVALVDPRVQFE